MVERLDINDWVCTESDESDYVIERFEIRITGKKPLILNKPSYSRLVFVTQQYLNLPLSTTKAIIKKCVIDSPDPLLLGDYLRLIEYLQSSEL